MLIYLLKLGELTLKGANRPTFEKILKQNAQILLKNTQAKVETGRGRFFVRCTEEERPAVEEALGRLFGISGWAEARIAEKTEESVLNACIAEGKKLFDQGKTTFKVEARRTDKRFPLDSYGIRSKAGAAVLSAVPGMRVDVHAPECRIDVEIREKAYIYGDARKGLRGLPVGTAGRGLLLLSGGIDSPVAGYLMAGRGLRIDGAYFHAYPYTSAEAEAKAVRLAEILGRYALGVRLYSVNFAEVHLRIRDAAPEPWFTVLLRMAMLEGAEILARRRGAKCLITGESLSQVASQTAENIASAESRTTLPVFRPLIGMDKEDIIRISQKIGAYETSILPYPDCCALFSPAHPILRGNPAESAQLYERLGLKALAESAVTKTLAEKP
ncbi:MAG: tRNA 4-thiouridine(8) synthase ThiI [Spirochaetaceae bacterium]|jgi:thiamine biosynthesis protein ThiI|nr:tRNA 4-thiouridine(8) synthase ThiI [Spirochaetaceae bacterium]